MRKKISVLLVCVLSCPFYSVGAEEAKGNLVTRAVQVPGEVAWQEADTLVAVDRESGRAIPLSMYDEGYLYAYLPKEDEILGKAAEPAVFPDLPEDNYGIKPLSVRGVFTGDENGLFRPEEVLSRAQMAVLLARIFDEEAPAGAAVYPDAPLDSWYGPAVTALYEKGVFSLDEAFDPQRQVTREELTAMLYRMLSGMDVLKVPSEEEKQRLETEWGDFSEVSAYAKEAYQAMHYNDYLLLCDWEWGVFEDLADDLCYLYPRETITRREAAAYLYQVIRDFIHGTASALPRTGVDRPEAARMPRIDGSTSTYALTQAIYQMLFVNGENHPLYPEKHAKTSAAYERLIQGETDVIFVPDPSEEIKKMAADQGVELEMIPIAKEALVFFTGKDNRTTGLTSGQVEEIYLNNSYTNWKELGGPDAPFTAFCRNNDSGSHAQMERFFLRGREINEDIRRERTAIAMSSILTEVQDYEWEHPGSYALGYSVYYYFQNVKDILSVDSLKLLAVDGVTPSDETLADSSYPLTTNYFAVIRKDAPAGAPARSLVTWLTGATGQMCVGNAGLGPLSQEERIFE